MAKPTLSEALERDVVENTRFGLKTISTLKVEQFVAEYWQPGIAFVRLLTARSRLSAWRNSINKAYTDGEIDNWILPEWAVFAFDGVYSSCVTYWMFLNEPPRDDGKISPRLGKYTNRTIKRFAEAIGAD